MVVVDCIVVVGFGCCCNGDIDVLVIDCCIVALACSDASVVVYFASGLAERVLLSVRRGASVYGQTVLPECSSGHE